MRTRVGCYRAPVVWVELACLVAAVKGHFPHQVVVVELRVHSPHVLESTRPRQQHPKEGRISRGRLDGSSSFSLRREGIRQANGSGELVCDFGMYMQRKIDGID